MIFLVQFEALAIFQRPQKFTGVYLFQILLEIMLLPRQISPQPLFHSQLDLPMRFYPIFRKALPFFTRVIQIVKIPFTV